MAILILFLVHLWANRRLRKRQQTTQAQNAKLKKQLARQYRQKQVLQDILARILVRSPLNPDKSAEKKVPIAQEWRAARFASSELGIGFFDVALGGSLDEDKTLADCDNDQVGDLRAEAEPSRKRKLSDAFPNEWFGEMSGAPGTDGRFELATYEPDANVKVEVSRKRKLSDAFPNEWFEDQLQV